MQMIDVLKRLAELDSAKVETISMTTSPSLGTVSNIEGEQINESITECGPMGMMGDRPTTPASFSINASAASGDEVSSMLRDIMNLAGVKPVADLPAFGGSKEIELEPAHDLEMEPEAPQSAGDEMGDLISMIDQMNGPTEVGAEMDDGSEVGVDVGGDEEVATSPIAKMADEVEEMTDELKDSGKGAGFDSTGNTPKPEVKKHQFGDDQVTTTGKEFPKANGGGHPGNMAESVDQVSLQLLKAYEAFKNGQ